MTKHTDEELKTTQAAIERLLRLRTVLCSSAFIRDAARAVYGTEAHAETQIPADIRDVTSLVATQAERIKELEGKADLKWKAVQTWVKEAMAFIDAAEADPIDFADRDLFEKAAHLMRDGYEFFGLDEDGACLAALEYQDIKLVLPATTAEFRTRFWGAVSELGNLHFNVPGPRTFNAIADLETLERFLRATPPAAPSLTENQAQVYREMHELATERLGYECILTALEDLERLKAAPSLPADVVELVDGLKPFAAVSRKAKGKDDACWCGQDGAVIRYSDLRTAERLVDAFADRVAGEEEKPAKKTMTLTLTDEEMAALEEIASAKDMTPRTIFRHALKVFQLEARGFATVNVDLGPLAAPPPAVAEQTGEEG